jgi:hypothetical protein
VDVIQACLFRCIWKQETLIFLVKVKNKDIISLKLHLRLNKMVDNNTPSGADPGFQVRGGAHRKIAPSWGRRENCWGISCEKSRFYAKKSYCFQLRREARTFLGYFVWKITILRQKIIFFPILGGGARRVSPPPLPPDPPLTFEFSQYV